MDLPWNAESLSRPGGTRAALSIVLVGCLMGLDPAEAFGRVSPWHNILVQQN